MLKVTLENYDVIYVKTIGEAYDIAHKKDQRIRKIESGE